MSLKIYNVLDGKKEEFVSQEENKVKMYACGITVSSDAHIGHAYQAVIFDTIRKYLRFIGYDVTYVRNYTDVDDKIIINARNKGEDPIAYAEHYIEKTNKEMDELGLEPPTIQSRATECIQDMIEFITKLIEKGHAYATPEGNVYFRVSSFPEYGKLSHQIIDETMSGVRKDVEPGKEDDRDFALWKAAGNDEIFWESPWGKGRPGWHIECSTMSMKYLGETLDIHGGGKDLRFPHHENEIAQSEATHGNKIAHYWMHNAFINFGNEKMSKSLGNVVYAKDMIAQYGGPVTRLVILNAHYRQPVNFTDETVKEAEQVILRMQMAYKQAALKLQSNNIDLNEGKPLFINKFLEALANDLNTSNALAELYNILKDINQHIRSKETDFVLLNNLFKTLTDMFYVLGLDINYVKFDDEISSLYKEYLLSKENKDFAKSDEIRKILIEKGVM